VNDHRIVFRGANQARRLRSKQDGKTPGQRAEEKRHLAGLRRTAAGGNALAALALLVGARPRRR
jgi:hypothetical protein